MESQQQRFFSHVIKGVEEHHCWIWCGAIGDDGYGRFWIKDEETGKQRVFRAHRYAMQLSLGRELEKAEHVLHRCDNPLCVRATTGEDSHLQRGDHGLNMVERSARGRSNFQALRSGTKKERATAARSLRDGIALKGYDHEAVQRFTRGLDAEQQTLF